jgi:hypothetical protein
VNRWGLLAIAVASLALWLILPTAPNYDTAMHLVWAQELSHGRMPLVDAPYSSTMHPLWVVAAFIADDSGGGAALLQFITVLSLIVVIAGAYLLAEGAAGRIAGVVAALCVGSSFALLVLAFKAYVDMPYLAVVMVALVVERRWRPGDRGLSMPALMFVAGLLRPEAWAIGLLFVALRLVPARGGVADAGRAAADPASAVDAPGGEPAAVAEAPARVAVRDLVVPALIVLAAPVIWALTDLALTGDPLHSLTGTQTLADELGRKTGLAAAPKQLVVLLGDLARPPIAAGGLLGVVLAVRFIGWRPLLLPLATLVASAVGFLLVGALGLPLLQRYLQLPAVMLCVFAGVAGAIVIAAARGRELTTARPAEAPANPSAGPDLHGKVGSPSPGAGAPAIRALAAAVLVVGVLGAGGYLALKAGSFRIVGQGVLREAKWQRQGAELVRTVRSKPGQTCGPISMPTYRFVPELTMRAHLYEGDVVSRATQLGGAGPQRTGLAITIDGNHAAKDRLGWAAGVPRATNAIPDGFTVVARNGPFVAAVRCPAGAPAGVSTS